MLREMTKPRNELSGVCAANETLDTRETSKAADRRIVKKKIILAG